MYVVIITWKLYSSFNGDTFGSGVRGVRHMLIIKPLNGGKSTTMFNMYPNFPTLETHEADVVSVIDSLMRMLI
jgi:hypothetical protein